MTDVFYGRQAVIATMHGKEKVIAPVLEAGLGIKCEVPANFDTDRYGTFSGETERNGSPLNTVRQKCLDAMEKYGVNIGIASEGSFGPHPSMFFAHANEEILMFIDKRNDLEVVVKELSTDTNFNGRLIEQIDSLIEFANLVHFPSHALILKTGPNKLEGMVKGITDRVKLMEDAEEMLNHFGSLYVETDMRAHFNPSRMKVIAKTAQKLLETLQKLCPQCNTPGFTVQDVRRGLPCLQCKLPTKSVQTLLHICKKCSYTQEQWYPHGKKFEQPDYCDYCNP
jgi:hypothetical protein